MDATMVDPKKLRPGVSEMTKEMVNRYRKEFGDNPPMHVSIGFNNMWVLLNDVLPRAIAKHGGYSQDALARAARETDIPDGGTMQAYGVHFFPPGHAMAGQNERAFPAIYQILDGKLVVVFPKTFANAAPILPLPASSPFAAR
jgi:branched-chain amino acid transport system substrate-binding protein